mmetsp:Transcript_117646/g.374841  ORF Transcript_117646/g.374841 Transcript_117646/m.374841 type:complete len:112 (+) Transcript_117646:2144-2479(+)
MEQTWWCTYHSSPLPPLMADCAAKADGESTEGTSIGTSIVLVEISTALAGIMGRAKHLVSSPPVLRLGIQKKGSTQATESLLPDPPRQPGSACPRSLGPRRVGLIVTSIEH